VRRRAAAGRRSRAFDRSIDRARRASNLDASMRRIYRSTRAGSAGFATMLASIALGTNVVLPPYFRTTLCTLAYDFLDGRGHEIFKKEALDSFRCSQAQRTNPANL
jgi:hypothetical protein